MNRMFTIFMATLKRNSRDRGSLLQMLLLPIVIIFILGNALHSSFTYDEISPTNVGVLNLDQGEIGGYFNSFIESDELQDLVTVTVVESKEEGMEQLKRGEFLALIELDANFTQRVYSGEKVAIDFRYRPENPLRVSIVEHVIESFTEQANLTQVLLTMGATENLAHSSQDMIKDYPVAASEIMPGAMDYYAVTMLMMIIMYGAMYSAFGMGESYLAAIGNRIKSTPVRAAEHYGGLVLGNVATVYFQGLILLAFTKYVYGVNWGDNLPLILIIMFVITCVSIGLGAMIVMVTKDSTLSSGILNVIIPVFTFVAGGYINLSFPGKLSWLQYISPNYLAQTAVFNTIYGGPTQQTMLTLGGLILFVISTFTVAMMAQRRTAR
ncbi:MAG: ABC transporter permease [Firmicutes bacterium]|nr:ABC transporter permease [Bacillota bacterium]